VSIRARALPPLSPPNRPNATAAGFFFVFAMRNNSHKPEAIESRNSKRVNHNACHLCWMIAPRLSRNISRRNEFDGVLILWHYGIYE
jgi:hypothetical protein